MNNYYNETGPNSND